MPLGDIRNLRVVMLPLGHAKRLIAAHHYLGSVPGGTKISFGVTLGPRLLGTLLFGVSSANGYRLVEGAKQSDGLTLSRVWLSDELGTNSESRCLGYVIRQLRIHTRTRFLISYADPSVGHIGTIYQATNWIYTGLSNATPRYDIGDGVERHSRSLSHAFGSHSKEWFASQWIDVRSIPQAAKHRYVYFLDPAWSDRLRVPVLPYPKREVSDASN